MIAEGKNSTASKQIVIVGNGMVSWKFCERIRHHDPERVYRVTIIGDEPRPAYDRVQLSSYISGSTVEDLTMASREWYGESGFTLHTGEQVVQIDRETKSVTTDSGNTYRYDILILATGSSAFVPPVPGREKEGVFVYRTIEDLDQIVAYGRNVKTATVMGGGLLGLEAAKACKDLGLTTSVVEFAPRLMPRQLDETGAGLLKYNIEELGVKVYLDRSTRQILGADNIMGLEFDDDEVLETEMLVISAGIRPRDELAKSSGLETGPRGGIIVDDQLRTSDEHIFCVGEAALHSGMIYGLVAPGYDMADVVASNLCGGQRKFEGADMSTKLKLLGVDVASLGDPFVPESESRSISVHDEHNEIYKRIVISKDRKKLLGAILVGNVDEYSSLLRLIKSSQPLPESPEALIIRSAGEMPVGAGVEGMSDDEQVCSCNMITKGGLCCSIRNNELRTIDDVKKCTTAGTGCGGCLPLVTDLFKAEMKKAGVAVKNHLCEHFAYSRKELFEIVKIRQYKTFADALAGAGQGNGCEICKPTLGSIFASLWNEHIVEQDTIQDTNDRFLANIQRQGLYSVVPRVPGGEITPDKLIVLGEVAKKYGLYSKITGGQRIDLFGAKVNQLPEIWEDLINAGFESGHAYGKALRTVKSCVGTTWCRFGVQDSVGFAIRVEERYKGIRAPHKLKSAVSGCTRECAEAQSKDFGLIATEKGWNLYVCGNGGAKPRHADLLAVDLDEETTIKYIDRFLMYYIHTADKLTRTSVWLDKMEGGLAHLKEVIIDDKLGLCDQLEEDMDRLVNTYKCEWTEVIRNPEKRRKFTHFANSPEGDRRVSFTPQRNQQHPSGWHVSEGNEEKVKAVKEKLSASTSAWTWEQVARVSDFPADGGMAIKHGDYQVAVFNFSSRDEWYACQNLCPHKRDMVLSRGIIGDANEIPKVACPQHKKTFCLSTGEGINDPEYSIHTFEVRIEDGAVLLHLPSVEALEKMDIQNTECSGCTACAR